MPVNTTKEIRIIKVPLNERERQPDYPQAFPRMPELYLTLLENKAKIKQDLIGKDYVPDAEQHFGIADNQVHDYKHDPKYEPKNEHREHKPYSDDYKDTNSDEEIRFKENMEIHEDNHSGRFSNKYNYHNRESESERSDSESSQSDRSSESSILDRRDSDDNESSSDDLSLRLKELLRDDSDAFSRESREKFSHDKYSRNYNRSIESKQYAPYEKFREARRDQYVPPTTNADIPNRPPTLAELEAKGQYQRQPELRDINHITMSEQQDEDRKRELMFKFDILRQSHPTAGDTIPTFTIHSDYNTMQKTYDMAVRKLSLDTTVDQYKQYLRLGFIGTEFVFGSMLGFDMAGFTKQQMINMPSYDRLLIEMGEKSYVPSGSKWPVEIRLLGLIILNAATFIIGKMIMKKTGADLMNTISGGMSNNSRPSNFVPPRPKRRMRGPNIDLDQIPDADEVDDTGGQQSAQQGAQQSAQAN